MNTLETKTMTSLEIAELTGKRHDHVLRDIRKMILAFENANKKEVSPKLGWHCESGSYVDAQGKSREMFRLDKTTTITLLSGYDVIARHKIVSRWEQLEAERTDALAQATNGQADQLLIFTERSKQIANSKEVNSFNFSNGGKEQAIAYNRANCFYHTGKTPHELVEWAKKRNVPSKFRTSAKEVIRTFKPAVGASMALADDFCKTGKIGIEQAASLCKTHALPIFEKMQEFGLLKGPQYQLK